MSLPYENATSGERALRRLIADDAHAMTFQTLGQYRSALLAAIKEAMSAPWMPPLPEPFNATVYHESFLARLRQLQADAARAALEQAAKVLTQHQIPVGNSAAGELACEWTYEAIKECHAKILALAKEITP